MDDATTMPPASILVIDDEAENLKLVGRLLSEQGYTVRLVPQAQMALRSANAHPPDLVLLDIRLPDMDGYAVCAALKADPRTHAVPVIFCSALGETIDKVRAFTSGGVDFITKPFDADEVLARVATHIALRRAQRQLQQQNDQLQQEIAERRRAEAEARQSRDELATQCRSRSRLVTTLALDPLLERILQELGRGSSASTARPSASSRARRWSSARFTAPAVQRQSAGRSRGSAACEATLHGAVPPAADLGRPGARRRRASLSGADRSCGARAIGTLLDGRSAGRQRTGDWCAALFFTIRWTTYEHRVQDRVQIFANQAAVAIENARLSEIGPGVSGARGAQPHRARLARRGLAEPVLRQFDRRGTARCPQSLAGQKAPGSRGYAHAHARRAGRDARPVVRAAPGWAHRQALGPPAGLVMHGVYQPHADPGRAVGGRRGQLQPQVQEMLYRIAQEALNNISKYAAANAARIALTVQPGGGRARDRRRWARVRGGQELNNSHRDWDYARARGEDRRPADDRQPARRRHHDHGHLARTNGSAYSAAALSHGTHHQADSLCAWWVQAVQTS